MQRVKHTIRSAYGYTDEQILDHIEQYGQEWIMDAYEMVMEDHNRDMQLMLSMVPLARTPMDKKLGKALAKYGKDLRKNIEIMLVPWLEERRIEAIRERLSKPPKSVVYDERGNVVDLNDPDWWKKEV